MALFTMKILSCVAVVVLSMAHSSAQIVEGKKTAARLFGAQRELRGDCENLDAFFFDGDATKTCDDYVADKPNKRCKKKQPGTGKKVKFFCPSACKKKCKKTSSPTSSPTVTRGDCENLDSFRFEGNAHRTCDSYVAAKPNKRCKKEQPGSGTKKKLKKVKFFCPATCKRKCKNTNSPTTTPTASPTASPTATPTVSDSEVPTSNPTTSPSESSYPSLTPSESPSESSYPSSMPVPRK